MRKKAGKHTKMTGVSTATRKVAPVSSLVAGDEERFWRIRLWAATRARTTPSARRASNRPFVTAPQAGITLFVGPVRDNPEQPVNRKEQCTQTVYKRGL